MAGNALAIFQDQEVPAHIAAAMESGESNITSSTLITNSLTFPGKVWTMTVDGNKRKLTRTNADGDEEQVQIFSGIILAYPERKGRAMYVGAYDPDKETPPVCWSNDGITPDMNNPGRKSDKCATCKLSAKGSKVTDQGKATTACSQHLMAAIIPAAKVGDFPPLRLKLPITSVWDGQNQAAQNSGWYGFSNYMDVLKSQRVNLTYMMSTRIRFDSDANYPKLQFTPGKWLPQEQFEIADRIAKSPEIEALLRTEFNPAAAQAEAAPIEEEDEPEEFTPVVTAKPGKASAATTKPKAAPAVVEDDDEPVALAPKTAPKATAPNPKVAQAQAAAQQRKQAAHEVEPDEDVPATPKPKAGGKAAAATAPVASSKAVNQVLADWDDE